MQGAKRKGKLTIQHQSTTKQSGIMQQQAPTIPLELAEVGLDQVHYICLI